MDTVRALDFCHHLTGQHRPDAAPPDPLTGRWADVVVTLLAPAHPPAVDQVLPRRNCAAAGSLRQSSGYLASPTPPQACSAGHCGITVPAGKSLLKEAVRTPAFCNDRTDLGGCGPQGGPSNSGGATRTRWCWDRAAAPCTAAQLPA